VGSWTEQTLAAKGYAVQGSRAVPVAPAAPRRHPSIAEQWADREDQRRESELQAEVEVWLTGEVAACRVLCWTHVRSPRKDRPGLPDLVIGLAPGLVVAVELKRPDGTGRLRPEQETWLRAWGERGAVCCSLAQVQAQVRAWRVGA